MIPALLPLALAIPVLTHPQKADTMNPSTRLVHVTNSFRFQLAAPLTRVAPLFGPNGERCWAGEHWDPQFLYPQTARDQPDRDIEGAVFTVQHGAHNSIWVTTVFDLAAGRMQYVAVVPDLLLSVIEVKLTRIDSSRTAVVVTYARTALAPIANDDVNGMGAADRDSGPHWQEAIEACLNAKR
jgi:hypothetical protein